MRMRIFEFLLVLAKDPHHCIFFKVTGVNSNDLPSAPFRVEVGFSLELFPHTFLTTVSYAQKFHNKAIS